jgi:hypothetical protein
LACGAAAFAPAWPVCWALPWPSHRSAVVCAAAAGTITAAQNSTSASRLTAWRIPALEADRSDGFVRVTEGI